MGYRVIVAGVPIECDSAEEALALAEQAGGLATEGTATVPRITPVRPPTASRWTEARMKDFFARIGGNGRKLIDELLDHPEGRTDEQLIAALPGIGEGKALAGVFTGLWKNAKKVGSDPNDVYRKQSVTIADKRQHEYTLSDSFRAIAQEIRSKLKK